MDILLLPVRETENNRRYTVPDLNSRLYLIQSVFLSIKKMHIDLDKRGIFLYHLVHEIIMELVHEHSRLRYFELGKPGSI